MHYYTTHHGRMHHFQCGPGIEEQVAGTGPSVFVATSPRAFDSGQIVAVCRFKPGVMQVIFRKGNKCIMVYSKDEFLPEAKLAC